MSKRPKNDKKPFISRIFYLDICNNPSLKSKLNFCIKNLGGTVEEFLDKKVRYVVTDRAQKDWPTEKRIETDKNDSSKTAESKPDLLTLARGKRLAFKTPAQQPTTSKSSDVLEIALKLRMKILTYKSILDFCKQYMKIPNGERPGDESNTIKINQVTGVKFKTLRAPFIKFEDNEEKYQPSVKEFESWPQLDLNAPPGTCPFGNVMLNKNKQKPTTVTTTGANLSVNPAASATAQASVTPALSVKVRETTKPVLAQKKRQRVLFCEICCKEFTNMSEHIKTDYHQQYMVNDEHYKELRSVIDSLPNWSTLNDVKRFHEDETSDVESEFETEMESEITTSEDDNEEEDDIDDVDEDDDEENDNVVEPQTIQENVNLKSLTSDKEDKEETESILNLKRKESLLTDDEESFSNKSSKLQTKLNLKQDESLAVNKLTQLTTTLDEKKPEDDTKKHDNDDYRSNVEPSNSVVINLNNELSRAFGEGSLLPLHRHLLPHQDNVLN